MANDYNAYTGRGNLADPPILRHTQAGTPVANARFCSNRVYRNARGELVDEETWLDLRFWGRSAVAAADLLGRGSYVKIYGRVTTGSYLREVGDEVVKIPTFEINVRKFDVLGGRPGTQEDAHQALGNEQASGDGARGTPEPVVAHRAESAPSTHVNSDEIGHDQVGPGDMPEPEDLGDSPF